VESPRRIIGNITLSLDGRTTGPGGPYDMGWIVPHSVSDEARDALVGMTKGTTALLGRVNYEGFGSYWPAVARDETAEPRDRKFAQWMDDVEKVVFSTTLTELSWKNSKHAESGPAETAQALRRSGDGDVWVLNSQSIIRQLLEADELDRLVIDLAPELIGAGDKLFRDGLPTSAWTLAESAPSTSGAIRLAYDRKREVAA